MSTDIPNTLAGEMTQITASAVENLESWDGDLAPDEKTLTIDVDGYEGPLDLLLDLARRQKVDLAKISILALAEQYLHFVEEVRKLRIELAADYLVMAAWLAFLKSKLLLPEPEEEEGASGEELAAQLAFRLRRLEAMRDAGRRLVNRNRKGKDFFVRGKPEPILIDSKKKFSATFYDLLTAYATQRQRTCVTTVKIEKREVWSLMDAREILTKLVGEMNDWTSLDSFLLKYIDDPKMRASITASTFAASLELVREGELLLRQENAFEAILMKPVGGTDVTTNIPIG